MNRIILLLLLLGCFNICLAQGDIYNSTSFVEKANEYIVSEKYKEARQILSKVYDTDDLYVDAQVLIGESYSYEGKNDQAISHYKSLYSDQELFEKSPELYVEFGSALKVGEQFEESEKIFLEGEKLFPNYSHLLFNQSLMYYRKGDLQKSIDYAKKTVEVNPGHARGHYFLGILALESGSVAEGALALLGYLAHNPNDDYAQQAILSLNLKMAQNYLEKKEVVISDVGDDFSQLEMILRNQLALSPKYKLKCDIDDVYTRQVQAVAEYASTHTMKDGFFEQKYIPFLADIYKQDQIVNFTYYTLSGMEESEEILKKKMKKIEKFYTEYFVPNFWYSFGMRERDHFGEKKKVAVFCDNSVPYNVVEIKDRKQEGRAMFLDSYGRMDGEATYKNDEPNGIVTYYNPEGLKTEESNYINGIKEGPQKAYYKNGTVSADWNLKNGKLSGVYTSYFIDGSVMCKSSFVDDQIDGRSFCNYEDGTMKYEQTFKLGSLQGERINYHIDGSVASKENFKDNMYHGISEYFDISGRKISSVMYKEDKISENYTLKNKEGEVTYEYIVDGKNVKTKDYINGKLTQVISYKGDEMETLESYFDGNKYAKQSFKKGKTKELLYFKNKNDKGEKIKIDNHEFRDWKGNIISKRSYKDGIINGENTYYYANGEKRSTLNYKEGKEDGTSVFYDKFGDKKSEYTISMDKLEGDYTEYKRGIKQYTYNYSDGNLNGPSYSYHANGTMASEGLYKNGEPNGKFKYYDYKGNLSSVDNYDEGTLLETKILTKSGEIVESISFYEKSREYDIAPNDMSSSTHFTLVNGAYHGTYHKQDTNGDTIYSAYFVNGKRHGKVRYLAGTGKVNFEGNYQIGSLTGEAKYYDDFGVLRLTSEFEDDKENGIEKIRSYDGSIIDESRSINDERYGVRTIMNTKGELLIKLRYDEGNIMAYKMNEKEGWQDIGIEKVPLNRYYEDGNISLEITINRRLIDDKFSMYDPGGKKIMERNFANGRLDGESIFCYPSGEPYRKKSFKKGYLDGPAEYYDESGNIILKYANKHNNIDGPYEQFENGKRILHKIYEDEELVEIK